MPYYNQRRRKQPYRKRYVKRAPATQQPTTGAAIAKLASDVWMLKGLVNSEMYHFDTSSTTSVSNAGSVIPLTNIAQGDDINVRTGNSIFVRSVYIIINLSQHASATNTLYRYSLIQDTQQVSDADPAITDIYQTAVPQSPLKIGNMGRFKVLASRFATLSINGNQQEVIRKFKKLRLHVRYNATASTDIQKNGLYLVQTADEATNTPTSVSYVRVSYHDN